MGPPPHLPSDQASVLKGADMLRCAREGHPERSRQLADALLTRGQAAWRRVVVTAAQSGIPAPAFSSSLSYYDGIRADRLPAALVQGQRDFFGAHTYKRIDKEGTFHTLWSGDRSEIEAEDTHSVRREAAVEIPAGDDAMAVTKGVRVDV